MHTNDSSHSDQTARGPRRILLALAGTAAAASLAVGLSGVPALATSGTASSAASDEATATTQSASETTSADSITVAETVAAKASPSVGTVQAYIQTSTTQGISMGSCVLIDDEGHILTNYHVVRNATEVQVTLNDTDYEATVLGSDPTSDLAVLEITPDENTPDPIEQGSSSDLALGEWVMTIGTPMGETNSVSQGIVSGLNRTASYDLDTTEAYYTGLIQTDAMINSGSSGGALVNAEGQLVGITTLSSTTTGDYAGMTYAIPSDYAYSVAEQIIENGVVEHPYMGVSLADLTPYNYQSVGSDAYWGAYVGEVVEGSPADEAGIEAGDVITAIDDDDVTSATTAIIATRSHEIGDTVTVTLDRQGETVEVEVTLGSDQSSDTTTGTTVSTDDDDADDDDSTSGVGGVFSFFGKDTGSDDDASDEDSSDDATTDESDSDDGTSGGWGVGDVGWGYGSGSDGSGSWGYYWSNPGSGYGGGSGYGYGYGSGSGYGGGTGYGSGYGSGTGYGYGSQGTPTSATVSMPLSGTETL